MSSLGDGLFRALSGGRPSAYEGGGVVMMLNRLVVASGGSMRAAARAAGLPATSVRMWASGTRKMSSKKQATALPVIVAALRRATMTTADEARMRHLRPQVTGDDRYDGRKGRKIRPGGPRLSDAIVDAYLSGKDADDIAAAFVGAIVDAADFYPGYFASNSPDSGIDVTKVEWV